MSTTLIHGLQLFCDVSLRPPFPLHADGSARHRTARPRPTAIRPGWGWRYGYPAYGYPAYGYPGWGWGFGYGVGWGIATTPAWGWPTYYAAPSWVPQDVAVPAPWVSPSISDGVAAAPATPAPAPAPAAPQVAPQQPSYWYYCTEPAGYYPYVNQCSRPWIAVQPISK